MSAGIDTIVWDLGGVLVDWNPLFVYNEQYFNSPSDRDYFFSHICTSDWNEQQDAGYSLQQATADKLALFFRRLKERGQFKFFALTNWSAETFPIALDRFEFLHWFDGRLVSGEEGTRKPFPEFYQLLFSRYQVNPSSAVFIDDNLRNVKAGEALGLQGIHFQSATQLHEELKLLGISGH